MYIQALQLHNFRNYAHLDLSFHPGLTILTGENAQGKTNLLEAIFLLSLAKSHRTNHDGDLIQWGKEEAYLSAQIQTKNFEIPLEMRIHKKGKNVRVNYLEQKKLSEFIGKLNVVFFAPEDLQIVKGSPGLRRRFLDVELGQSHPFYLRTLLTYQRILKQRNRYLKDYGMSQQFDPLYYDILTQQFIETACQIIRFRLDFIEKISNLAQPLLWELSNQRDRLTMAYLPCHLYLDYKQVDGLETQFHTLLQKQITREKERGTTSIGPHRDDIAFYLDEKPANLYGSQGQQRTIILALKLAEVQLLKEITGEYPVLLLDDVLSELDEKRKHLLMQTIKDKVQTLLTTASIEGISSELLNQAHVLFINKGQIIEPTEGACIIDR